MSTHTKRWTKRAITLLLALSMLLGMLPISALAAGTMPDIDLAFRTMTISNVNGGGNYSEFYTQGENKFENKFKKPVRFGNDDVWVRLTYAIQVSQEISLELYELQYDGSEPDNPMVLEPAADPNELEDFIKGHRLGYIQGVRIKDNVDTDPSGGDLAAAEQVIGKDLPDGFWAGKATDTTLIEKVEKFENVYAFGYHGEKAPPSPTQTAAADEPDDELDAGVAEPAQDGDSPADTAPVEDESPTSLEEPAPFEEPAPSEEPAPTEEPAPSEEPAPTEASEMFHIDKSAENAEFSGFLVHSITTSDFEFSYFFNSA